MQITIYLLFLIACATSTEPTVEELDPVKAGAWTKEQLAQEIEHCKTARNYGRLHLILSFMTAEHFHEFEPMLFQLFSEAPPASEVVRPEVPSNDSYRRIFRSALFSRTQDHELIERFMLHQGRTHKGCAELVRDTRPERADALYPEYSDEVMTCMLILKHMHECFVTVHHDDQEPVKSEHVQNVPGCLRLRESVEQDFSHWEAMHPVLRAPESTQEPAMIP